MACRAAGQLVLITAGVSFLFTAVALIGNRSLLYLIFGQAEAAVMDNACHIFLSDGSVLSFFGFV